jgi:hypothetical protein
MIITIREFCVLKPEGVVYFGKLRVAPSIYPIKCVFLSVVKTPYNNMAILSLCPHTNIPL